MRIKFNKQPRQLNGQFWTKAISRRFMEENQSKLAEAVRHNMNYYRIIENGMLVHVYDAYEIE